MSLLLRRLLLRRSRPLCPLSPTSLAVAVAVAVALPTRLPPPLPTSLSFNRESHTSHPPSPAPAATAAAADDHGSLLSEAEFHRLADLTLESLQERLEEYGDDIELDGFDIDYGNQVLTLRLGGLGTYVVNKQTPNRQIWLSSPVSGPSRFDWDERGKAWVYRRTNANLLLLLEDEVGKLCGKPVTLS